jgi:hypothetical protein
VDFQEWEIEDGTIFFLALVRCMTLDLLPKSGRDYD